MSSYFWDILANSWHFTLPSFGLNRVLPIFKSHNISFGFWLRITGEGANCPTISTAMVSNTLVSKSTQLHKHWITAQQETPIPYPVLNLERSEIRVFLLHPGSDGDVVSGSMECCDLGTARDSFEALSYVWGAIDDNAIIIVDGNYVPVTKSLEAALRHLRFQDSSRTLWVDYVCINQNDVDERNSQVSKMGLIYELGKSKYYQ